MNNDLFQVRSLIKPSFMQKLLGQKPEENAIIEFNNLLATKNILDITQIDISEIENRYSLTLSTEFPLNLQEFYAVYLNYCHCKNPFGVNQYPEINHLEQILKLDYQSINIIQQKIGSLTYRRNFEQAITNGRLTPIDKESLDKLKEVLQLTNTIAENIAIETQTKYIENYVNQIIKHQRFSPKEEKELNAIFNNFNIIFNLNEKTLIQLNKLKLYWKLENLDLPIINCGIDLQKLEVCHLIESNVSWYEPRCERQRLSTTPTDNRVYTTKSFYLNSPFSKIQNLKIDKLKFVDSGLLFLTNKRIILVGSRKKYNIRIEKIIYYVPYQDGIEICKDTGKSPLLQLTEKPDIFSIILERILKGI